MVYGLLVGVILGASKVGIATAIPVLLGLVCLKGLAEITFRRSWITGGPSPYSYYLEQLAHAGPVSARAWVGYLAQVLLFGTLLGGVGYVGLADPVLASGRRTTAGRFQPPVSPPVFDPWRAPSR